MHVLFLGLPRIEVRRGQLADRLDAARVEAGNIFFAVDYLGSVTKSLLDSDLKDGKFVSPKGKHVLVIGGGDTGNDCVGTVIRLGAKSVTQLEMMPKPAECRTAQNPWPEWPRVLKTDYGQEEAIAVFGHDPRVYQTTVTEFLKDSKGNVQKAKVVKLKPQKDEKTGRMNMVPVEGSEEIIDRLESVFGKTLWRLLPAAAGREARGQGQELPLLGCGAALGTPTPALPPAGR